MSRDFVPENTAKNTKWVTTMFSSWLESRNRRTGESTPMDYLHGCFSTEASKVELARILSLFVVEAKKKGWKSLPCQNSVSLAKWHSSLYA